MPQVAPGWVVRVEGPSLVRPDVRGVSEVSDPSGAGCGLPETEATPSGLTYATDGSLRILVSCALDRVAAKPSMLAE